MKNTNQAQQNLLQKAEQFRIKSMEEDAKLIMTLAQAVSMILAVASEIQDRHKYDMFPITEEPYTEDPQ